MDWTIEVAILPVTDVDRTKAFYESIGFAADHDHTVSDEVRFVQMTPPGSNCSIAFGKGLTDAEPGSRPLHIICVSDINAAREQLLAAGVEVSDVDVQAWGHFVYFGDPDDNRWSVQYLPYRYAS